MPQSASAPQSLFWIAGQSNARGTGTANPAAGPGPGREFLYSSGDLRPLIDPAGEEVLGFQPAKTGSLLPAFGQAYFAAAGREPVMVHTATGGSSLLPVTDLYARGNWSAEGGHFANAVRKVERAMLQTGLPLSGLLWSQGETDAIALAEGIITPEDYRVALHDLLDRFHKRFPGVPAYLILTGGHEQPGYREAFDRVRQLQEAAAAADPLVHIGSRLAASFFAPGYMQPDGLHYTQAGYEALGADLGRNVAAREKD